MLSRLSPAVIAAAYWLGSIAKPQYGLWWLIPVLAVITYTVLAASIRLGIQAVAPLGFMLLFPNGIWNSSFLSLGAGARQAVRNSVAGVTHQAAALVLGITDGDTSMFSRSELTELKQLSLSHLTAVSGTNCSILLGALTLLLGRTLLSRSMRFLAALAVLFLYLQLVGEQASVLRAAAMAIVVLLGAQIGSKFRGTHLLSSAVVGLLMIDPSLATDLGLVLSVAATAGLLWLAPNLNKSLVRLLPEWLAMALSVALAAQLACLPVLVAIQPNFSLGGLPANLLAEPMVAPATLLGLAGALFAVLGGPATSLAHILFWLASIFGQFIVAEAHWLSQSTDSVSLPTGSYGFFFAFALLSTTYALSSDVRKLRPVGWVSAALVLVLISPSLFRMLPASGYPVANWVMVSCDVGQGDATVLRSGSSIAVIDVGRDPKPIDSCLRRLSITKISLLVLTHFDMDHVGGLAGAIDGRKVAKTLLTQFVDERPGAKMVERILHAAKIPIRKVSLGYTGTLGTSEGPGSLRYIVLTPHRGGEGSTSSNDGSVSMFWHSKAVNVFTMADLPASGQTRVLEESSMWWNPRYSTVPTILKVSHHGSADQDPNFISWVHAAIATVSVGAGNPYGHPTDKALSWLKMWALKTLRTDQLGSISIGVNHEKLIWAHSGGG